MARKSGVKHQLIVYRHSHYGTLRWPAFVLGVVALAVWALGPEPLWHPWGEPLWVQAVGDASFPWLLVALVCYVLWAFALLAPRLVYAQARPEGLRIGTPFWPLTVPYRSINTVRTVGFGQIFPATKAPGRDRGWLKEYAGQSAVAVDLLSMPFSRDTLWAFLGPYVALPRDKMLCLLVKDWMAFSQELEHFRAQSLDEDKMRRMKDSTDEMISRWHTGTRRR